MDGLPGFLLAGLALTGSPGPATLSLAAAGAAFGWRAALAYIMGIVTGMIVVMAVTATGVTGVVLAVPGVTPVGAAVAALYFAYLAVRIATAPPLSEGAVKRRPLSFGGGFALSLVNPKGYAAMAALFSGFAPAARQPVFDVALKMLVLTAIMIVVDIGWLLAGSALTGLLRRPRANRAINLAFAALLLGSVAVVLLL